MSCFTVDTGNSRLELAECGISSGVNNSNSLDVKINRVNHPHRE
jgi:hypothetical protein